MAAAASHFQRYRKDSETKLIRAESGQRQITHHYQP